MTPCKPQKRAKDVTKRALFTLAAVSFLAVGCGQNRPVSDAPAPAAECTESADPHAPNGLGCAGQRLENAWGGGDNQTASEPTIDFLQPQLFIALGIVILSLYTLRWREDEHTLRDLPPHRDQRGPAAGRILADADRGRVLGWVGIAAAVVLFGSLWGAGGAVLAGIPAGLVVWAVYARYGHLTTVRGGYAIADERWMRAASEQEMMGKRPPREPRMSRADAHSLGLTKGFEAPAGSAATTMLDIAGRPGPIHAVWAAVAQAMKLGAVDSETGAFTPWATIADVIVAESGDVTVVWTLSDVTKTAESFRQVGGQLCRELRVREIVGGFQTRFETGQVYAVFSNGGKAAGAPQAAPVDDDWDF